MPTTTSFHPGMSEDAQNKFLLAPRWDKTGTFQEQFSEHFASQFGSKSDITATTPLPSSSQAYVNMNTTHSELQVVSVSRFNEIWDGNTTKRV